MSMLLMQFAVRGVVYSPTTLERYERIGAIAKQKVFIVDDEKQIAEVLTLGLPKTGFDVETFYDARSALLRASDCLPDILISDVVMPEMDGIALAKALRELNPNCKVVLISGNPEWKTREDWRGRGLDGFVLLPKPFALSQLLSLLKSHEGRVTGRCSYQSTIG
jgi:DNA-binding response OmpR family regulator